MKKQIIKIIATLSFLFITASAVAQNSIEFVYYYPPGGGTDSYSAPLAESLSNQGFSVERTFFRTCAEAVRYVNQNPNGRVIVASSHDMHPTKAGRCPGLDSSNLQWVSNIMEAPHYLCTVPSKPHLTLEDLFSGKEFAIGSVSSESGTLQLKAFVKYNKNNLNVKLIPYEGGGALRIAALSGRDIDFVLAGNDAPIFIKEGSTCLASTSKDNYFNLPHIANFLEGFEYPSFALNLSLWSVGDLTSTETEALINAFRSEEFVGFLQTREGVVHRGIASDVPVNNQFNSVKKQIQALDFLREN